MSYLHSGPEISLRYLCLSLCPFLSLIPSSSLCLQRLEAEAGSLLWLSVSFFLKQGLSLHGAHQFARLVAQQVSRILLSSPPNSRITGINQDAQLFNVGTGDLNLGPPACRASILPIEPSA